VAYEFLHNSGSSNFDFDYREDVTYLDIIDFGENDTYKTFIDYTGDGDEKLNFRGVYGGLASTDEAVFALRAGIYVLDTDYVWKRPDDTSAFFVKADAQNFNTSTDEIAVTNVENLNVDDVIVFQAESPSTLPANITENKSYYIVEKNNSLDWIKIAEEEGGTALTFDDEGLGTPTFCVPKIVIPVQPSFIGFDTVISFVTEKIPAMSNEKIDIFLYKGNVEFRNWFNMNVFIENPSQLGESIEYRTTQDENYPNDLRLNDAYYGAGPYLFSKSGLRDSTNTALFEFKRRGEVSYTTYNAVKTTEVLNYQRVRQPKKVFDIYGEIDPTLVSVFDGDNYMYFGGSYSDGRWQLRGVRIEEVLDV
jgi:hypothetical protein